MVSQLQAPVELAAQEAAKAAARAGKEAVMTGVGQKTRMAVVSGKGSEEPSDPEELKQLVAQGSHKVVQTTLAAGTVAAKEVLCFVGIDWLSWLSVLAGNGATQRASHRIDCSRADCG